MDTTLLINTRLGEQQVSGDKGPLLLSSIQGIEGISMPYAYDVTLFRTIELGDLDPASMIATPATIMMRGKTPTFTYRRGIFQTFDKAGTNEVKWERGMQTDYRVYKARIVPAWKMLDYESRYRVWEDKTVIDILLEVLGGFNDILKDYSNPASYLSFHYVQDRDKLPKIPYCVQFGESSLVFAHRLMAQFGFWYKFEHAYQASSKATRERMVVGNALGLFDPCAYDQMEVDYGSPSDKKITAFQRAFQPPHKRAWVSDFNMLDPTDTARGHQDVSKTYDMLPGAADPTPFEREVFPAQMKAPVETSEAMDDQAKDRIEDEEGSTFMVQGQSKNPTFMAGQHFTVYKDDTKTAQAPDKRGLPTDDMYLITQISFAAYDNSLGHEWAQDVGNWLDSPFRWVYGLFRDDNTQQGSFFDPMGAVASGGLANWVQNQSIINTSPNPPAWLPQDNPYQANFGDSFVSGMNTALVQALMQMYLVNAPKEIMGRYSDGYSNAFIAVPWDTPTYQLVPGPDAIKPRAYGPHLAVVVGQDGADDMANGGSADIYADGLGRVRVRFPWQRVVPMPPGLVDDPDFGATDPMKSDRRCCWVPVSESWAGSSFGTQFLPRIGQEVIVSFLDGDPERPIITGRRYNADQGHANMPFPPNQKVGEKYTIDEWLKPVPSNDFAFNGIKTASTQTARSPDGDDTTPRYHLLRFDDTQNCEQLLIRSQGRLDVTAYAHSFYTTNGNNNLRVVQGKDPKGKPIGGNMFTTIDGEYDLHVGGDRYEQADKNYELTVKGDVGVDVKGALKAVIKGDVSIAVNSLVIEATTKITLKVGQSFVVIDPCQVHCNGANVYKTPSGSADSAASVSLKDIADAAKAEPGDEWNKRLTPCAGQGGGHGKRGEHKEDPTPGPDCPELHGGAIFCNFLPGGGSGSDPTA